MPDWLWITILVIVGVVIVGVSLWAGRDSGGE
jgi:hypothetical protein